jgi:hypothetical protein
VAIDIALPVVLVLMILVIGASIVYLTVRSRQRQQRTGEESEQRRDDRGDVRP